MTTALANRTKETLAISPDLKSAVKHRETLNDDELAGYIERAVLTLKMVAPLVAEMKRRFQNLDRSKQVDGTYKTIRGCRSFKDYCQTVLHRTEQAVYLMLRGDEAKPKPSKSEPKPKPVHEYEKLVDMLPVIRVGGEIVPPSEYSAAEVTETAIKFIDNVVVNLNDADKLIVYRSLLRRFESLLAGEIAA
jgi:hypothetical protein